MLTDFLRRAFGGPRYSAPTPIDGRGARDWTRPPGGAKVNAGPFVPVDVRAEDIAFGLDSRGPSITFRGRFYRPVGDMPPPRPEVFRRARLVECLADDVGRPSILIEFGILEVGSTIDVDPDAPRILLDLAPRVARELASDLARSLDDLAAIGGGR